MSRYVPTFPGDGILPQWLYDELSQVAQAMAQPTDVIFEENFTPPASPKEGMVLLADGTSWDPGSGRGLYLYSSGAWVKL